MVEPITIGYTQAKWLKDDDTNFIGLFRPTNATGTKTMHTYLDVDYSVPAGKQLYLLGCDSEVAQWTIYYDTSIDTAGTNVWQGLNSGSNHYHAELWAIIPASNYVSVYCNATANAEMHLWGVETTT